MASVQLKNGRWVVRWREGGRDSPQRSITCTSERRAHALAEEIEEQVNRTGRYEPRRAGRSSPAEVILVDYLADVARRRQPNTLRRYAQMLELWRRYIGDHALADEVFTYTHLADYHAHLSDPETGRHLHRRQPETVRKPVECIELLWRWAWQRQARGTYHGVPQPDSLGLERPAPPHKLAPTWEEMDACIDMADGWQHQLYVLLRSTGLRVAQAMALQWSDLELAPNPRSPYTSDPHHPTLRIRPELGKSRQERRGRIIPIAPTLAAELAGWGRREGYVVESARTGENTRTARARDAQRAWARAGVRPEVWQGCAHHAFRAGFQSGLKRLGADPEAVEYLVGHSRGDVRERYVGPASLPLIEAVTLVPARNSDPPQNVAHLPTAARK